MNERIKELIEKATTIEYGVDNGFDRVVFDKEKFAELIVKECIELNRQELAFNAFERMLNRYKEHFGVEE
jgi:DNA-binding LacI/PurR family transcriptional regulator